MPSNCLLRFNRAPNSNDGSFDGRRHSTPQNDSSHTSSSSPCPVLISHINEHARAGADGGGVRGVRELACWVQRSFPSLTMPITEQLHPPHISLPGFSLSLSPPLSLSLPLSLWHFPNLPVCWPSWFSDAHLIILLCPPLAPFHY